MSVVDKVRHSFKFGRAIYLISLALTLSAAVGALISPDIIPTMALLKVLSVPVILYLFFSLGRKDEVYFWLNMGISRREYYLVPVVVEFLFFLVLISLCGFLGNVVE